MNWKELWMTLFGTTEWLGLNIGFWVALAAVLLIVILMNVLFWSMKPKTDTKNCPNKKEAYKKQGRYTNFRGVSPHVFSFSATQHTVFLLLTFAISCVTMILYLSFVLSLYRVSGYYLQYTCSLSWKIVSL